MKGVREAIEGAIEAGVQILTLFAFSSENWQRPAREIAALMALLEQYAKREREELVRQGVAVHVIGDLEPLPEVARAAVLDLEAEVRSELFTAPWPDPDLLIRTSGERRLSNFLLWQMAYTELFVTPVLWPDFTREDLFAAILDYQRRERRFGKVTV